MHREQTCLEEKSQEGFWWMKVALSCTKGHIVPRFCRSQMGTNWLEGLGMEKTFQLRKLKHGEVKQSEQSHVASYRIPHNLCAVSSAR